MYPCPFENDPSFTQLKPDGLLNWFAICETAGTKQDLQHETDGSEESS